MLGMVEATGACSPLDRGRRVWVGVTADQRLVAEAVCAALGSRGFSMESLDWIADNPDPAQQAPPASAIEGNHHLGRILLVVCDLDVAGRLRDALRVGRLGGLPWLVVDMGGPGPAWGALMEAGARTVVVSSVSLDELVEVLEVIASDGTPLNQLERRGFIRQWHAVRESPEQLWRQVLTMDERDREIVAMLYQGTTVGAIADRFGVSDAAVRAQVKAVLRQLSSDRRRDGEG